MTPPTPELSLLTKPIVVVDLETTGLSPLHDAIIEICAIRREPSGHTHTLHTLLNPPISLPPEITHLTGLTRENLIAAPSFADLAAPLRAIFTNATLIAHNALFDYSFLREEFRRLGITFQATTLCTARLARSLLPHLPSSALRPLALYLGIPLNGQHRALADAHTTLTIFLTLCKHAYASGIRTFQGLLKLQHHSSSKRDKDLAAQIQQLPQGPGVYCLRDAEGHIIYIGKAVNLRRRVQSHFRPSAYEPHRLRRLISTIALIDHIETGSELEALLLESRLIKQLLPTGNHAQRDYHQYPYLRLSTEDPFPRLSITRQVHADGATYYGPFHHAGPLNTILEELQRHLHLPRCTSPIIPGHTPICAYGQMGHCQAPCTGSVSQDNYAQTISILQDLLSGRSSTLIQQLEARRDTCAENLQFEQAAKLRDAINELNRLFHTQQRLSNAINNCHAVIITRSRAPFAVELFAIYSGLLRGQLRALPGVTSATHLATWLTKTYTQSHTLSATHVNKSDLDELHIIASWLHHQREQHHIIPVNPTEPHTCLTKLQQAIASFDLLPTTTALPSPTEPIASSPFP